MIDFLKEFLEFLTERKKYWLLPIIIVLALFGVLIVDKPKIAIIKPYDKIFTIHIQDPKVSIDKFDLIICAEHDNLTGNNVIKTTGAIHYLSEKEISRENDYLAIDKENKKIIAFIIGGPNKYYTYSD